MDTTGCPSGWASDNWIEFHPNTPCNVPLAAFFVIMGVLVSVRTVIITATWSYWYQRRNALRRGATSRVKQRHPIVPTILTLCWLMYVLMLSLVGSNVASAQNGGGLALYGIMCVLWGIYCLLYVGKFIRMGRRLIPMALTQPNAGAPESEHALMTAAEKSLAILNTFDLPLRILFSFLILTVACEVVFCVILGLLQPRDPRWARVHFGLVGTFGILVPLSLVWHLERLINTTKICGRAVTSTLEGRVKINHALKVMRCSQVVWLTTGIGCLTGHLLGAGQAIDLSWILVVCMLSIETTASSFGFLATRWRPKDRSNPKHSSMLMIRPDAQTRS